MVLLQGRGEHAVEAIAQTHGGIGYGDQTAVAHEVGEGFPIGKFEVVRSLHVVEEARRGVQLEHDVGGGYIRNLGLCGASQGGSHFRKEGLLVGGSIFCAGGGKDAVSQFVRAVGGHLGSGGYGIWRRDCGVMIQVSRGEYVAGNPQGSHEAIGYYRALRDGCGWSAVVCVWSVNLSIQQGCGRETVNGLEIVVDEIAADVRFAGVIFNADTVALMGPIAPVVDDVVHVIEIGYIRAQLRVPLVVAGPDIVMHRDAPAFLEGRGIVGHRAGVKGIRDEAPGDGDVAHFSPDIHSGIGGVQDGEVIDDDVLRVVIGPRVSVDLHEIGVVWPGVRAALIQAQESQVPQDDVMSAADFELVRVVHLRESNSGRGSGGAVNGEKWSVDGELFRDRNCSRNVEDDGSRAGAIQCAVAKTSRAAVSEGCDVVDVSACAADCCVTIPFIGDGWDSGLARRWAGHECEGHQQGRHLECFRDSVRYEFKTMHTLRSGRHHGQFSDKSSLFFQKIRLG